jgi:hypothetical protein
LMQIVQAKADNNTAQPDAYFARSKRQESGPGPSICADSLGRRSKSR